MTLAPELKDYIDAARWFGGKGRAWEVGTIRRVGTVPGSTPDLTVVIDLVEIAYAEGEPEFYQVPLALYPHREERLDHALIGMTDAEGTGELFAYDALHDRASMALWLQAFAAAADGKMTADALAFHRVAGHDLDTEVHSTLFSGEQSNSSVAFGEDSLLKVFRKVTPGVNPDVSIHEVLTRAGSDHVAALFGWLDYVDMEPDGTYSTIQLAMLQQFLRTGTDGFELALASVRNLLAEADLHAEEVGGDFAGEAARLGRALAETHGSLAEHFPVATRSTDEMSVLAGAMKDRLIAAIDVVPALATHAETLHATYDALGSLTDVTVQQIHGDLHLGQTLRTARGWKIVDFEGEPAKALAERLLPDSPWRDIAGMLRSFDYAPRVVTMTSLALDPGADEEAQRAYRAAEWSARNAHAFLAAYAERDLTTTEQTLLDAYVADKAVYEAVYEARNRPTWVDIPLEAITRLAKDSSTRRTETA